MFILMLMIDDIFGQKCDILQTYYRTGMVRGGLNVLEGPRDSCPIKEYLLQFPG